MTEQNRLPLASVGWEWTTLGEVCFVNPRWWDVELTDDDVVSFVPMAAVEEETGHLDVSIVRKWKEVKQGYTRFQENDVLFAKITPSMENGKAALAVNLVEGRGVGSTEFHVLRPTSGVLPKQILYFVLQKQFREAARRVMKGVAGQLRVPPEFVAQTVFPLPPRSEQQRIVDEIEKQFSRLDSAVEMLQRVERNLERLRTATLKAAVEGRLVPTEAELARAEGRDYELADVLLQRILRKRRANWEADQLAKMKEQGKAPKDDKWKAKYEDPNPPEISNHTPLAEGWTWTNLDQLKLFSLYGPRFSSDNYNPEGYLVLRTSDISDSGRVNINTAPKLLLKDEEFKKYKLEKGDLLITRTGSIGTLAVFNDDVEAIAGAYLIQYRLVPEMMTSWFVFFFLKSPAGQNQLLAGGAGIGRLNLNVPTIETIPVPLPPLAEQQRIVYEIERRISVIEELKTLVANALRRAAVLRQKILRDAFAGKLVPQDPADEPAGILLESIRVEKAEREAEASQARKERRGKMKGRKAKPSTRKPRRLLREVVAESKRRLTPEHLFDEAGFTPEVVEFFYEELRSEIEDRHIEQVRPDSAKVYLIVGNA